MDLQNKASFPSYALLLLTWNAIAAFSEESVAKLVAKLVHRSGGSRGRSQGATEPPFQSSYYGFTATISSYLSQFL